MNCPSALSPPCATVSLSSQPGLVSFHLPYLTAICRFKRLPGLVVPSGTVERRLALVICRLTVAMLADSSKRRVSSSIASSPHASSFATSSGKNGCSRSAQISLAARQQTRRASWKAAVYPGASTASFGPFAADTLLVCVPFAQPTDN